MHARRLILYLIVFVAACKGSGAGALAATYSGPGDDTDYQHAAHFEASLTAVSDNVFLGRKDSVPLPYLSPALALYSRGGFYAQLTVAFALNGGQTRLDVTTLEGGLDKDLGKYSLSVAQRFFIYSQSSVAVRSHTLGETYVSGAYENGWLRPELTADVSYGSKPDGYVSFSLGHRIALLDDALEITPAAAIFAGTQNYYMAHLRQRSKKAVESKEFAVQEGGGFAVLDYELSIPVSYEQGHWLFSLTPYYDLPVHPVIVRRDKKTFTQPLSNTFWVMAELNYRLKTGRHRR